MLSLRLTRTVQNVLLVLAQNHGRETHGREIVQAASILPGTVYPVLIRMLDAGWLSDRWEAPEENPGGRPPRRYYRLRPGTIRELQQALDEASYTLPGLAQALYEAAE